MSHHYSRYFMISPRSDTRVRFAEDISTCFGALLRPLNQPGNIKIAHLKLTGVKNNLFMVCLGSFHNHLISPLVSIILHQKYLRLSLRVYFSLSVSPPGGVL